MNLKYLNGIYQAKVTSLLSDDNYRALEQLNHFDFLEYLKNIGYGDSSTYLTIEDVLVKEALNTRVELNQLTESTLIGDVMFINNDLNNIKIIYKSNRYDIEIDNYDLVSRFSKEALEQYIKYDNRSLINDFDLLLLSQIKDIEQTNIKDELQTIEKLFYNYYYSKIEKAFKPLALYVETLNFVNNLNTFLKMRNRKTSKETLNNALLYQTKFPLKEWEELLDKDNEAILYKVSLLYYGKLEAAVKQFFNNGDTELLFVATNKVLNELTQDLSYNHNDIGPIVSYIHLKITEINNVRRLYYGNTK